MLSDSDSDTNDLHKLTINEHFAKAFEYKKEREELAKLKEKYGSDYSGSGSSDDDSEDTEEDSDGEELTPAVDAAILRTLARIRKKDPAIYEGGRRVFEEEHTRTQDKAPITKPKRKGKSKPLTVREAALASALADAGPHSRSPSPRPLTHSEEQALLRSETRAAFHDAINSETQGDGDDLLIPRSRTQDEVELEEEEYKAFLQREVGEDIHNLVSVDTNEAVGTSEHSNTVKDGREKFEVKKKKGKKEREKEKDEVQSKKPTKKRVKTSKEEADQEFLMSYIFNRGWIDRSNRRVPTYNEIVESSSKYPKQKATGSQAGSDGDPNLAEDEDEAQRATLSDEESFDDLADAFETSYNFRFEEPGGALITSFPRGLSSVRREYTTRKDARTRKKQRQEAEKQALLEARREEIRKERALIEATVAEEDREEDTLLVENGSFTKKKSKNQQRREELARLKALQANELRRKLEMVSSEGGLTGLDNEALAHLDLDADWDPSRHDAQMAELYGGDVDDADVRKPTWDDDINIDDIVPSANTKSKAELKKQKKKEKKKKREGGQDEDVGVDVDEMDADLDAGGGWAEDDEEWRGTEEERKRKVDAYMDEVVNRLGFSGITSHVPTRFHYTSVTPENYALTPVEILLATDAELNSYVGLKKMAPYRVDRGGKAKRSWDPKRIQRLKEFRENLYSRAGSQGSGPWLLDTDAKSRAAEGQGEKKKRKGKKERAKLKAMQNGKDEEGGGGSDTNIQLEAASKSHKRKYEPDVSSHSHAPLADGAEDAEDGAPKKKRRRRHKGGPGGEATGGVVGS